MFTTHTHDGFKCLSPRDHVDTNFMPGYLVHEIEYSTNSSQTKKIQITQHLLTCKHLEAVDED
jgi:hypothetical protein